jgi:stress-induced morphogen
LKIVLFPPHHLVVECESQFHNVSRGAEKHFRVQICSEKFNGLSQLQRQRMVNKLLAEELQNQIHALRIEAKTPEEWNGQEQAPAPKCLGGGKSIHN